MITLPMGVANSISANFDFDPCDTLPFARQGGFDIVQIYLSEKLLDQPSRLQAIRKESASIGWLLYHAEGYLNEEFCASDYRRKLCEYLATVDNPAYILHFDERENIDTLIRLVEQLRSEPPHPQIYLENYYITPGKIAAEKNFKKFLALFTLSNNFGQVIYPVLDIPRIFHRNLELSEDESLEWCYQVFNFFGNRNISLLLHLIDASAPEQSRHQFCALGDGYIPYDKIFHFILKTRPKLSGAILEFEDKINPLKSRDYIQRALNGEL